MISFTSRALEVNGRKLSDSRVGKGGVTESWSRCGFEFHVAEANSESDQPLNSAKRAVSCMG